MSLALLGLIQSQETPRLSKTVIAVAVLAFAVGVALLVYFFRRYKKTEKESQDDWELRDRSLFAAALPTVGREEGDSPAEAEVAIENAAPENEEPRAVIADEPERVPSRPAPSEPEIPVVAGPLTQELQSDLAPTMQAPQPSAAASSYERPTELLSSETREAEVAESDAKTDATPFDDDVWAGLEKAVHEASPATQLLGVEPSDEHPAQAPVPGGVVESAQPPAQTELLGVARVDQRPPREPFEPRRISRIAQREAWETPRIEPLKPRVQPVTQSESPLAGTQMLASPPPPDQQQAANAEAGVDSKPSPESLEAGHVAPAAASGVKSSMRGGSVLGLPAESSRAPLVLGAPAKPKDEIGIGALVNYGRDMDGGGGHGGTIALAAVILLLGSGIATYLFVPSVNSQVNAMVARARGIDPNPPQPVEQPKARIFPGRNEANKNMVKARGAVDNISEETLSSLSVEVSLERGNGAAPELRTVAVNPAQLAPKQRGVFEFEYNGNRATGFSGYRIVRLLSGEAEIKFTTPARTG